MKKILFALLAVLFTIALVATCDIFEPALDDVEDDSPQFTPDGRPLVRVTIDLGEEGISRALIPGNASTVTDTSRALISEKASPSTDIYEVVFKDPQGGTIYRSVFNGSTTQLKIPANVDYQGASNAVVFAGKNNTPDNNYTLLAIGRITSIGTTNIGTGAAAVIPEGTGIIVTFTLETLTSHVGTSGTSFAITNSSNVNVPGAVDGTIPPDIYVFPLPDSGTGYRATYTITGGLATNFGGVMVNGSQSTTLVKATGVSEIGNDVYKEFDGTVTFKSTLSDGSSMTSGSIPFDITIGTVTTPGYAKFSLDLPVVAISNNSGTTGINTTPVSAGNWRIRGGLQNSALDVDPPSDGGAVMLKVGIPEAAPKWATIDVNPVFPN